MCQDAWCEQYFSKKKSKKVPNLLQRPDHPRPPQKVGREIFQFWQSLQKPFKVGVTKFPRVNIKAGRKKVSVCISSLYRFFNFSKGPYVKKKSLFDAHFRIMKNALKSPPLEGRVVGKWDAARSAEFFFFGLITTPLLKWLYICFGDIVPKVCYTFLPHELTCHMVHTCSSYT